MFLQEGLGRTSTRYLSQPPVGGNWVMPRYSRRPILTTSISVKDFRKFTFTTSKKDRDFVVCHKGLSFVVNATRRKGTLTYAFGGEE